MKTKRILSMMLAGLMVVSLTVSSMSLAVYADETETQLNESPSVSQENQGEAPAGDYSNMPLIEDFEAPVLHSISIDKTEVATGEEITLTVEATDDLSGIEYIHAYFVNKENGREISFDFDLYDSETNDNDLYTTTVSVNEFEPSGVFELEIVRLSDRSGSR